MHFAQGLTPHNRAGLSTQHSAAEAGTLSRALENARRVTSNIDFKKATDPCVAHPFYDASKDIAAVQEAVRGVVRLPAALLGDLSPPDVIFASRILITIEVKHDKIEREILDAIERILDVLTAADTSGALGDIPNLPPLSTELGPPRHFDYGAAIKRARIGVMIELCTIPLYLYAMYSVKPRCDGLQVQALLRCILQQEMLHLALSGNLLSALGGNVILYDSRIVPMYPGALLCTKIPMNLEPLSSGSLGRFMEIEAPVDASHPSQTGDRNALGSQYDSIGQLYEDLVLSVRGLEDQRFTNNLNNQFVGQDSFDTQLFAVVNQSTALRALATIIEQGEGNLNVPNSHYEVFSKLYSGPPCDVYKVPTNPRTKDYAADPYLYRLSLSFDAAYCYLLQTIERVWQTNDVSTRLVLLRNMHGIMSNVLGDLAGLFVQKKFKDGCAGPCFNYYPMRGSVALHPLVPVKLHEALVAEVALAAAAITPDSIGKAAQQAAGKVDVKVQNASKKAPAPAPGSSNATEAAAIAAQVHNVGTHVQQAQPSDVATIVTLATQMANDAVQVAFHTRGAARLGSETNIKAAREAADAAVEVDNAAEDALSAAGRGNAKATLERLEHYIADHLYPPFCQ